MIRRSDVGRRPESLLRIIHEIAQVDVGEIQPGLSLAIEAQAHSLIRKRLSHVISFAFMGQESARGDLLDFAIRAIHKRFVLLVEAP